jgi:hypothetical protein
MTLLVTGIMAGMGPVGCTKEEEVRATDSAAPARETSASLPVADTPLAPEPRKPVGHPVPLRPARDSAARRAEVKPTPSAPTPAPTPSPSSPAAAPGPEAAPDKWLSYDPATNTVTFELIAGPFTFNGYRNGEGTLLVPSKANMVINFINKDGTPHSAIVISGEGPIPNSATDPAIPRAYTTKVLEGLPQEGSDVMRFPVPETGSYRIFCGVPGHGLSGMWIWLKIDPAAKAPSFGPTKE